MREWQMAALDCAVFWLFGLFFSLLSLNSHKECLFVVFWGQLEISRAFVWRIEFRNKGEDSLIKNTA
jgi:hypothetical protein